MLLINCPYCGPRPEAEFTYAGEAHIVRPADPASVDDAAWTEFLYLRANPHDLWLRTRRDKNRPLLQTEDPKARLEALYEVRDPLYRECAHFVIETGRPSVNGLVNMVLMQLEMAGVAKHPAS